MSALFVELTRPLLADVTAHMHDDACPELARTDAFALLALAAPKLSWAMVVDGQPRVAAGLIQHWFGRAEAWMIVTTRATRRDLVTSTRACSRFLDALQCDHAFGRIEMWMERNACLRTHFAHALGFELEAECPCWDPLGRTFMLLSRIA